MLIDPTLVVAALEQSAEEPRALAKAPVDDEATGAAPAYELIDKILHANRSHDSLEVYRKQATEGKG